VFIIENEIEGGDRNGVALGSVRFLDANGGDTGEATGVVWSGQDNCATNVGNQIPPTVGKFRVVAGARLLNITIARNRIRRMGLSGIGPVGVFDLVEAIETISIENLTISGNAIEGCLAWPLENNGFGYGAISTPDVKALRVFDNSIVDFGATPGAERAWGVFVLFGELVEISRNRILETRDFSLVDRDEKGAPSTGRGGIAIAGVAPLSFTSDAAIAKWAPADAYVPAAISPAFEPGVPALRIENNTVRVACGMALEAVGLGPFSILGNHLATGGPVPVSGEAIATTVLLLNLGRPIEFDQPFDKVFGALQCEIERLGLAGRAFARRFDQRHAAVFQQHLPARSAREPRARLYLGVCRDARPRSVRQQRLPGRRPARHAPSPGRRVHPRHDDPGGQQPVPGERVDGRRIGADLRRDEHNLAQHVDLLDPAGRRRDVETRTRRQCVLGLTGWGRAQRTSHDFGASPWLTQRRARIPTRRFRPRSAPRRPPPTDKEPRACR
jgi:hypothetical protein